MPAILDYVDKFSARWKDALGMADIAQRSIDAQNFAVVGSFLIIESWIYHEAVKVY